MNVGNRVLLLGIVLCAVGLLLLSWGGAAPATAAPDDLPANAEPFACYTATTPQPDDGNWSQPEACYSDALATNPFAGGLTAGKVAIVTDVTITPATSTAGNYDYGLSEATTGGFQYFPQVKWRETGAISVQAHNRAPLVTVTSGNVINIYNASGSPGAADFFIQGYIVDDLTVNPTALGNLNVALAPQTGLLQGALLLLMIGLAWFTYRQARVADEG
ncbi:MAG: hypothetical protein R3272_16030 [Candidatus Promineifilaceae bacterium]|nr:hypothetical protein [Candidatus Promineifilaceae bacterium]